MTDTRLRAGTAKLRPRARLISLLGEELISDEPVALVELVKNSYDADATYVEVRFEGGNPQHPDRILVIDDGVGMTLGTVLHSWLEPGTDAKRKKEKSDGGRLFQGAKGIGRFSAARLARSLLLETTAYDTKESVLLALNWGDFDENTYLEDIEIEYETFESTRSQGTQLTMEYVRNVWTDASYQELYDRLSRLISPFEEVRHFKIMLDIPGYPQYSGEVQPPDIILNPRYLLRGELDRTGYFLGEFIFEGEVKSAWGRDWWEGQQEKNKTLAADFTLFPTLKRGQSDISPLCGGFGFEIRVWDRDREGLGPYTERYSKGIREIRNILNRYSGVSIYRDGFRVYPYGQRGNDWLQLDNRSRQVPARNLANNQIVAAIRISREDNPQLIDRSNREGMVSNGAFLALEEWFVEVLSILEEERYRLRPRRTTTKESPNQLFEPFDLASTIQQARIALGDSHPVFLELSRAATEIDEGVERIQEVFSRLLMSAGLGHMVDVVIHEIGRPIGSINRRLIMLQKSIDESRSDSPEVAQHIQAIKGSIEDIHNLRERLDPHTPAKRGRAEVFDVIEEIENNFALYEALMHKQRITYEITPHSLNLQVRMARSSLSQIVANLIDNSVFWLIRDKGSGKGGKIHVDVSETEGGFRVLFSDDGPGVAPEDKINIFEPYFTKKPNGIGLGLYIARLIIEPYGRITCSDECHLPGACFEVLFEKGVGR